MNVVILHCHYQRGGVTQVVENHIRWLRSCSVVDQIALVAGGRWDGLSSDALSGVERIQVEGFDYDTRLIDADSRVNRSADIGDQLTRRLRDHGLSSDTTVLHWHNHSLGKNTSAPDVIRSLAASGWPCLLHIHDFAEDNRPENLWRLIQATGARDKSDIGRYLYPVASQIHYATLTRGDADVLARIGVPAERTHWLPNSVVAPCSEPLPRESSLALVRKTLQLDPASRWSVYPVRGIRRKNVGEFLLLTRWLRPNQYAGLTLEPTTPVERASYRWWRSLAPRVAPRAVFDAGHHPEISFAQNLAAADFVLSTSVAEGFGMAFLEPWLMRREVIARAITGVTDDFQETGVQLPKLYSQIAIPGPRDWIDQSRADYCEAWRRAWDSLPIQFRPESPNVSDWDDATIDFACLAVRRQSQVLQRMADDSVFENDVKQANESMVGFLHDDADADLIDANQNAVSKNYAPDHIGQRLLKIYQSLLDSPRGAEIAGAAAADSAIDLIAQVKPYYPCRTEVIE